MKTKLNKEEIFSAPAVPESFPPQAEVLRELIAARGASVDTCFSLGNVLLRTGDLSGAIDSYREALRLNELSPELHTNLGVALYLSERFEEALASFRQAILLNPNLVLPQLHSGRAQLALRDLDGAESSFRKVLRLDAGREEGYLKLAELAELRGDTEESLRLHSEVFRINPDTAAARTRLAVSAFTNGRGLFDAGRLEEAFSVWAKAERLYAPAFSVEQAIVSELQLLSRAYNESEDLDRMRNDYLQNWADPEKRKGLTHRYFGRFLFSRGLVPECYEHPETFDGEITRWQTSLQTLGEHPYPHFRLGLLRAYMGQLVEAEAEIRYCQDKLLPKKQTALKLDQILDFVKKLQDLDKQAREGLKAHSPDFEWEEQGFDNVFERNSWKQAGLGPLTAKIWRAAGFSAVKAKAWHREEVLPEAAKAWMENGIEPRPAKRWIRAGISAADAKPWVASFGENVEQAIQCRSVGFTDPALAAEWMTIVMMPWDAIRWHELGFRPEDARTFIEKGIRDPNQADEHRARELGDVSEES